MAKLEMDKNTPLEFGLYSLGDHLLNPFKGEKLVMSNVLMKLLKQVN